MIEKKTSFSKIIIYSEISWNFLEQRHHHLAKYFADKNYQVEFVQRVFSRVPSVREIVSRIILASAGNSKSPIRKDIPCNVTLRRSLFLPLDFPLSGIYNWILWFCFERRHQKNAIVYSFVNNPFLIGGDFPIGARYSLSVFDIIHNWWESPWRKRLHSVMADRNIKAFDKVVTDSPLIAKDLVYKKIPHHMMLPGAGPEWLNISSTSTKVAPVFFGNLRLNSDVELIRCISGKYSTDLLGLIHSSVADSIGEAHYLGEFNTADLIKRVSNYNVILLPYDQGEFSKTIAPAKYFEALATGALVVTGADMSHLPGFNDFVFRVDSLSHKALDGLQEAIAAQSINRQAQVAFAGQHLWKKRFEDLFFFLEVE
jgi:hypothetical protein